MEPTLLFSINKYPNVKTPMCLDVVNICMKLHLCAQKKTNPFQIMTLVCTYLQIYLLFTYLLACLHTYSLTYSLNYLLT